VTPHSIFLRNGTRLDDSVGQALTFVDKDGSYQAYRLASVATDSHLSEGDVRAANKIIARMGAQPS
jgi:hypothetical protein